MPRRKRIKREIKKDPVRLMKSEKYELTEYEKMIEFYRDDPVEAARDLLSFEPIWFQRKQLRELWTKPFCLMKWGRAAAKTSTGAVYLTLKAMLYPNMKIGVIGPAGRQTGYVFDEIEDLYAKSPFFRAATKGHVSRSPERSIVKFHNNSSIEGLPIGQDGSKIRGRRYTLAFLDEFSFHNAETISLVVRPFLAVKREGRANQIIISSTPYYRTNHFYTVYLNYLNKSRISPELYSCTSYNFVDVVIARSKSYEIDLNQVMDNFLEMPFSDFLMEWGGHFPREGAGFFDAQLILDCEPRRNPVEMEFTGDPDSMYVMGIDAARSDKGDNFALTIMKILGENTRHTVKVVTRKGKSYPELANLIKEQVFLSKFNITKIVMDNDANGKAIADLLVMPFAHEGKAYPSIVQESQVDMNNYDKERTLPILEMFNFNIPTIDYLYTTFKADMEHQRILFPITIRRDPDDRIQTLGNEFAMLKAEMQHILPKPTTQGLRFEGHPKIGKDRITSAVLANHAANALYKKGLGLVDEKQYTLPNAFWA